MEMSIEMKMQALDRIIEMRNQLIVMQDNMGAYNGFHKEDGILIYSTDEFLKIAKHINANIASEKQEYTDYTEISFNYNGTKFHTFILPCEYEKYKSRIDLGGGNNV